MNQLITILGPTATGKTKIATNLALEIKGEIISADSRQVFKGMDLGTGKDLDEYLIQGQKIPYHLIDIKKAGEEYSVFEFVKDFNSASNSIIERGNNPILCGGSTMYLDAILSNYELINVPDHFKLDQSLENLNNEELTLELKKLKKVHNSTDTSTKERLLSALRIEYFKKNNPESTLKPNPFKHVVFGIQLDSDQIKQKITKRLKERLKSGMIEEAQHLLEMGVSSERLKYYGLEYKYLAQFLDKEINYNDLFQKLNSAIHQFAKKQMTKYRKMENSGIKINWIDGTLSLEDKILFIREQLEIFHS